jgi:hypothetical protein
MHSRADGEWSNENGADACFEAQEEMKGLSCSLFTLLDVKMHGPFLAFANRGATVGENYFDPISTSAAMQPISMPQVGPTIFRLALRGSLGSPGYARHGPMR